MNTHHVEWRIQRAVINNEDIDSDEIAQKVSHCAQLVKASNMKLALRELPPLRFEWDWSNGDSGARQLFDGPDNFHLALTEENSITRLEADSDRLIVSVSVFFVFRTPASAAELSEIIEEKHLAYCGYVGGGWSYLGDEGQTLLVKPSDDGPRRRP